MLCTLEDGAQVLLADSGFLASFWGDAVLTVQYVHNCVPTLTILHGRTPFEIFHGKKPDLSHLRVWGCQCFIAIPPELHTKGGPRCFEGLFIGYEENRVKWRVRDLSGKVHFSCDVWATRLKHGGESSPVSRQSSRIATRSALSVTGWELLVADLVSLATVFPTSVDTSPISFLSVELDALAFAVLHPRPLRQWNLGKVPLSLRKPVHALTHMSGVRLWIVRLVA